MQSFQSSEKPLRSLLALAAAPFLPWVAVAGASMQAEGSQSQNYQVSGQSVSLSRSAGQGNAQVAAAPRSAKSVKSTSGRRRPPKLETGHDLSKVKTPITTGQPIGRQPLDPAQRVNPVGPAVGPATTQPSQGAAAPVDTGPSGNVAFGTDGGTFDFGDLMAGDVREHTFELSNDGEGDLVLTQIKPSCGCTVAQTVLLSDAGEETPYTMGAAIAPGTKFRVTARLNTKGKRGPMQSNVNLFGNDKRGVVPLVLKAKVNQYLEIQPTHLNFEMVNTAETRTDKIVVSSPIADAFGLRVDDSMIPPELKVTLVPIDPTPEGKAGKWEVQVVFGPGAPEGVKSYPFRLITDAPVEGAVANPDGVVPTHETLAYVMANVTGMVSAEPRYMSFGLVRPGQEVARTVKVKCNDPNGTIPAPTVKIAGFRGEFEYPDAVSTTVRPIEEGKVYEVELKVEGFPEDLNGSFRGKVMIETGHPDKPQLEINFSGVCRGGVPMPQQPRPPVPTPQPGGQTGHEGHDHGSGDDHKGHNHP